MSEEEIDLTEFLEENSIYELAGWKDFFKKSPSVLLVIDPQNDVLDEKGALSFWQVWKHARENNSIENIKRLIPACREKGIPVIWAMQYRLSGGKDIFPGTFEGDMLSLIRTLIPNAFEQDTWETEIYDDLKELIDPGDIIIGKHGSSMFEGTNLEKYLVNLGASNLIVTGFLTDFCIEATVRSACDRGYTAITVGDATATENEEIHVKALKRMERLIGPVVDTDTLIGLIGEYEVRPVPKEEEKFDLSEVGKSMAEGISLNDIADWTRYVDIEKTALIVIDPQNDNLHEKGSLSFIGSWKQARETGAIENVKVLVKACHETDVPVFWVKQNRLSGGRDIFPGTLDGKVMGLVHNFLPGAFLGDTWDTDIIDELKPLIRKNDIVIEKHGWSAFESTPLQRYLNSMGVTTIIVCGFLTDFCVESTVRNAADRGFMTIVASDASAASSDEDHQAALNRFDRLIGPVADTEKLIGLIKGK